MSSVKKEESKIERFLQSDKEELDEFREIVKKQIMLEKKRKPIIEDVEQKTAEMVEATDQIRDTIPQSVLDKLLQHTFDVSAGIRKLSLEDLRQINERWDLFIKEGKQVNRLLGELHQLNKEIEELVEREESVIEDQDELEKAIEELSEIVRREEGKAGEVENRVKELFEEERRILEELEELDEGLSDTEELDREESEEFESEAAENIDKILHNCGFMQGRGDFIIVFDLDGIDQQVIRESGKELWEHVKVDEERTAEAKKVAENLRKEAGTVRAEMGIFKVGLSERLGTAIQRYREEIRRLGQLFK